MCPVSESDRPARARYSLLSMGFLPSLLGAESFNWSHSEIFALRTELGIGPGSILRRYSVNGRAASFATLGHGSTRRPTIPKLQARSFLWDMFAPTGEANVGLHHSRHLMLAADVRRSDSSKTHVCHSGFPSGSTRYAVWHLEPCRLFSRDIR